MNLVQIRRLLKWLKKVRFLGTYCKDIYSSVIGKWYQKSWERFDQLKNIGQKYYYSDYNDANDVSINMVLNVEHR